MKLKLRLDKASILEFLIQNVEKIVLGVAALVFLFLVYSALTGVERYPQKPEQLRQVVQEGQRAIDATPPKTGLTVQEAVLKVFDETAQPEPALGRSEATFPPATAHRQTGPVAAGLV